MPLVPAKCTQCGAALDVDSAQEVAICPHCKTPFITEKAINNYNTTNVTNIGSLHADVVQLSDERSIDNRVKSGETFIKLDEYDKAATVFSSLISECPYDYRSWFGMIKVLTTNFTDLDISRAQLVEIVNHYDKAHKVADQNGKTAMGDICDQYINTVQQKLNTLANNTSVTIQQKIQANNQAISALNVQISELREKLKNFNTILGTIKVIYAIIGIIVSYLAFTGSFISGVISAVGFIFGGYLLYSILDSTRDSKKDSTYSKISLIESQISQQQQHFNFEMSELNNLYNKATADSKQ